MGFIDAADIGQFTAALVILALPLGLTYGPQAALYAEMFPAGVRYSGISVGYALGSILGGAFAAMIAQWIISATGKSWMVGVRHRHGPGVPGRRQPGPRTGRRHAARRMTLPPRPPAMTLPIRRQDLVDSVARALQHISHTHPADFPRTWPRPMRARPARPRAMR